MMGPGCIFKVEQTGVADGLDLEGERKRGVKNDSQTLGLGIWGMQVTSPGMEKRGGVGLWERSGAQVCVCCIGDLLIPHEKTSCGPLDM